MTQADWLAATDPAPMLGFLGDRMTPREQLNFMAGCLRRIWDLLTDDRYRRLVEAAEDWADGRDGEHQFRECAEAIPLPGGRLATPQADWRRDFDHQPADENEAVRPFHIGDPSRLPTGILNFGNLPNWVQQTHHAIENLARGDLHRVNRYAVFALEDHAAVIAGKGHSLQDTITRLQVDVRRAYDRAADAKWRGLGRHPEIEAEARKREQETEWEIADLRRQIESDAETVRRTAAAAERAAQAALLRGVVGNPFRRTPLDPAALTATVVALTRAVVEDRAYDRLPILADALEEAGFADRDTLEFLRGNPAVARGCWAIGAVLNRDAREQGA